MKTVITLLLEQLFYLVGLIFCIFCLFHNASAQFKYLGNDVWQTDTKTVREITKKLSEQADLEKEVQKFDSVVTYQDVKIDSLFKIITKQDIIIKKYDVLINEKNDLITELSKPVEIKRNKIFEFRGIITAGTYYDIAGENRNGTFIKDLKYYGGFKTEATILNTIKIAPELQIPLKLQLNAGIIVF